MLKNPDAKSVDLSAGFTGMGLFVFADGLVTVMPMAKLEDGRIELRFGHGDNFAYFVDGRRDEFVGGNRPPTMTAVQACDIVHYIPVLCVPSEGGFVVMESNVHWGRSP